MVKLHPRLLKAAAEHRARNKDAAYDAARQDLFWAACDFAEMFDPERVDPETQRGIVQAVEAFTTAKHALARPTRNEKQVKDEARARAESVSCFHVDQQLRVVAKGRHTITVAFFDGRSQEVTRTLEVACDDQYPDAIDILAEGEGE